MADTSIFGARAARELHRIIAWAEERDIGSVIQPGKPVQNAFE
ncbi:hypothetical protein [Hyphomicrobium sp. 1Nfss2.1]